MHTITPPSCTGVIVSVFINPKRSFPSALAKEKHSERRQRGSSARACLERATASYMYGWPNEMGRPPLVLYGGFAGVCWVCFLFFTRLFLVGRLSVPNCINDVMTPVPCFTCFPVFSVAREERWMGRRGKETK